MNNPYCKHGNHHAIRCLLCELDKRGEKSALNSLLEEAEEIKNAQRRAAAEKEIKEAAKRLDW